MAWSYVLIAGALEIIWVFTMKMSNGFTNLLPSVITIVLLIISFYFVAVAMKVLPVGTAYAVFTGIGTVGAVTVEFIMEPELISFMKILFLLLLITGIMGLKYTDRSEETAEEVRS
ncbi:DMT family transporter [Pontibacillus salicampi]|uniref:DMT family transporter n=1 Tax=Pontibacillus salicampi TaxID=1449801 RepID=A0ABV6LRR2_9BACI